MKFRTALWVLLAAAFAALLAYPAWSATNREIYATAIKNGSGKLYIPSSTPTASRACVFDASSIPAASSVTSTELGYLSGITSSVQTQISGKASKALDNLASTAVNASILPGTTGNIDLGSSSKHWLNGYIDTLYAPTIVASSGNLDVSASGGEIWLYTADQNASASSAIYHWTGNTTAAANDSGRVEVQTGTVSGAGSNSGYIRFVTGSSTTSGNTGDVMFEAGAATSGTQGEIYLAGRRVNVNNTKIVNLATPTANTDAATKAYVDGASITGNAATATALAANPADCSANQFATTIAASGDLSCSAVGDAALSTSYVKADGTRALTGNWNAGAFTITASTFSGALSGNASTATALAANPTDCSANQFANAIAASGNLTCSTIPNAATTATDANTASAIVARDATGLATLSAVKLDPTKAIVFWDDFLGFLPASMLNWGAAASGTAAAHTLRSDCENNRPGQLKLDAGTDATGRDAIITGSSYLLGGGSWSLTMAVYIDTLSDGTNTYIMRGGFNDNSAGAPVDGAGWIYDSATSANWGCQTSSNSSRTTTYGSVAVTTGWHTLGVTVDAGGTSVNCTVDGSSVTASPLTTNIPTGSGRHTAISLGIFKSAGSLSRFIYVDRVYGEFTPTSTRN